MGDKKKLFERFLTWLKPGGRLFISDYCIGTAPSSDEYKAYVADRGYFLPTVVEYGKIVESAGFSQVVAKDASDQFLAVLKSEVTKFQGFRDEFLKEFSEAEFDKILTGWTKKIGWCEA